MATPMVTAFLVKEGNTMKRMIIFAAMAALALTACQNNLVPNDFDAPSTVKTFTATTDSPSTKTTLNQNGSNYEVLWQNGDKIAVVDAASTPNMGVYSTTSTTKQGTFTFVSGNVVVEPNYKAYYPATLYNGGTPAIPATQQYAVDNIAGSPMYAESSTSNLAFKNICGIIRLNISTTMLSQSVASISISANEGMSGAISNLATLVSDGYVAAVGGTAGVALDCGEGVAISSKPTAFHFAVPANTYTGLTITVTTTDGLTKTRTAKSNIVVGRSSITDITLAFSDLLMVVDLTSSNDAVTIPSGVSAKLVGSNNRRSVIVAGGSSVITLQDATMHRLTINGDATVLVKGNNAIEPTNEYENPIVVSEGSTVIFQGNGSLSAQASYGCVVSGEKADLFFESGTYNMTANGCPSTILGKTITISGGIVNADGAGYYGGIRATTNLTITDGTVVSNGGWQGICVDNGNLSISGGNVTANQVWGFNGQSSCYYAGIGVNGGTITITGGTVLATGKCGPGIGGLSNGRSVSTSNISISGGNVTAKTESGYPAMGFPGCSCGDITVLENIDGLTLVKATSTDPMISTNNTAKITIDGVENPTEASSFEHLNFVTTTVDNVVTWTFTPKL